MQESHTSAVDVEESEVEADDVYNDGDTSDSNDIDDDDDDDDDNDEYDKYGGSDAANDTDNHSIRDNQYPVPLNDCEAVW